MRTAHNEMALRMLATAPDDNGDRYNYRMLVACLQASKLYAMAGPGRRDTPA